MSEMERLRLSGQQPGPVLPSCAFTPLLDIPLDNYTSSSVRSRSLSPSPTSSSHLTGSTLSTQHGRQYRLSPNRGENRASRSDEISLSVPDRDVASERGRSPVRSSRGRVRREASPDSIDGRLRRLEDYTEVSVRVPSQRQNTSLTDVFEPQREKSQPGRGSSQQLNGHSQNGHGVIRRAALQPVEYEIHTLTIPKAKQLLGEWNRETGILHLKSTLHVCARLFF